MSARRNDKSNVLKIDGNTGEGGGQIIRTALALSMLTGTPIELTNIRAGRTKPGLMRQHLMCVKASQQICNAQVTGDCLGSTSLTFIPGEVKQGDYTFDIGSAGSTSLVLQTVLPALLFAQGTIDQVTTAQMTTTQPTINQATTDSNDNKPKPSTVTVKGGTHNPLAPTTDFLNLAFVPALAKLGMRIDIELIQTGYAPVGGGEVKATVYPFLRHVSQPKFNLKSRYELLSVDLVASHLNLASDICKRELSSAKKVLIKAGIDESLITKKQVSQQGIGEGNSCYAVVTHSLIDDKSVNQTDISCVAIHSEMFSVLGEKRMSAERVGNRLAGLVKRYVFKTDALVDEYLTDQLLLPLALSGGGEFTARMVSGHSETQAWMIAQFLPVSITFENLGENKVLVRVC